MTYNMPPGAASHWQVTGERGCDYCERVFPLADLDGGRCPDCQTERCDSVHAGERCVGEPGHHGGHWSDCGVWAADDLPPAA